MKYCLVRREILFRSPSKRRRRAMPTSLHSNQLVLHAGAIHGRMQADSLFVRHIWIFIPVHGDDGRRVFASIRQGRKPRGKLGLHRRRAVAQPAQYEISWHGKNFGTQTHLGGLEILVKIHQTKKFTMAATLISLGPSSCQSSKGTSHALSKPAFALSIPVIKARWPPAELPATTILATSKPYSLACRATQCNAHRASSTAAGAKACDAKR